MTQRESVRSGAARHELGIYLHIPFCVRKCAYCDFLSAPAGEEIREAYVRQLCTEIRAFTVPEMYDVVSVFLGGGTPSLLSGKQILSILSAVKETFPYYKEIRRPSGAKKAREKQGMPLTVGGRAADFSKIEVTAECNPGTLTREKLLAMREGGVNRLSLGLQSADDRELKLLGRIHTWQEFLDNYRLARALGIDNLNVDLMSGLPGQTCEGWRDTLEAVASLEPEHISAYSLIIEEGTPFYQRYHQEDLRRSRGEDLDLALPSEEEERRMYEEAERSLNARGIYRYEISNYARPGRESIHNTGYWMRREYAGFGLGAASQIGTLRYKNTEKLEDYLKMPREMGKRLVPEKSPETISSPAQKETETAGVLLGWPREEITALTREDEIEETLFLGLRMTRGISTGDFREKFGEGLLERCQVPVRQLRAQGLLEASDGRIYLTKTGLSYADYVVSQLIS